MANSYFKFKQFTVQQDRAAMKVGTDGIVLGAWTRVGEGDSRILDIGTGTGLVALMLAQRTSARIDAIDSDPEAYAQAVENAKASPWKNRISLKHTSLQAYKTRRTYDCIVCNPPFYQNAFGMSENSRSRARHGVSLTYEDLAKHVARLLREGGTFTTILPTQYSDAFIECAMANGLYLSRICFAYPKPGAPGKRQLMAFTTHQQVPSVSDLTIETQVRHEYTVAFRKLTADFYLAH